MVVDVSLYLDCYDIMVVDVWLYSVQAHHVLLLVWLTSVLHKNFEFKYGLTIESKVCIKLAVTE